MKHLVIAAIAIVAFGLAACAHHEDHGYTGTSSTTSSTSRGYSK